MTFCFPLLASGFLPIHLFYYFSSMKKGRLEAFSDGVLAIIITIMVLELKVPHGEDIDAIKPLVHVFLSYVLSFIYIGIYWNNHHHMINAIDKVTGDVMWANLHLLFWLSLVPFVTAWMGENQFAAVPMALYGVVLLMAAIAYYILQTLLLKHHSHDSVLVRAIKGNDLKGKISPALYIVGILATWISPWISGAMYVLVALMWVIPDRRIEKAIHEKEK